MKYNRNEAYKILEEFIDICKKNKIWYSAAENTLLGVQRHGGFVPWFEKIQVMMTPESYRKLLRLFPKRVIDSSIIDNYKSLQAAFVNDSEMWDIEKPFIEIIIILPTTIKKVKGFKSIIKNTKNAFLFRKPNLRNVIDDLYSINNEGYFTIISKKSKVISSWIPNLSFSTITKRFGPLEIEVISEYLSFLEIKYGKDYMKAKIPNHQFIFPAPGKTIKEKI